MKLDIQHITPSQCVHWHGADWILLKEGGVLWPAKDWLILSDCHLGKGQHYVRKGHPIPTSDIEATLSTLAWLVSHYQPQTLVLLGDSFHSESSYAQLSVAQQQQLHHSLSQVTEVKWVVGNHDPHIPDALPGESVAFIEAMGILFHHEPNFSHEGPQCIGHFHPKATVRLGIKSVTGKVFAWSPDIWVMPAFGQYTGGLDVADQVFASWLPNPDIRLIHPKGVFSVSSHKKAPRSRSI